MAGKICPECGEQTFFLTPQGPNPSCSGLITSGRYT